MYVFSAADAVSPAIQRTRDFLFRPFRWGTYLKLGLVAIVTEGVGSNVHSSSNSSSSTGPGPHSFPGFHLTPMMIATIVAAVLLAMVVAFFVCYLITRLRFAFFHCLIHNSKEIGPGWRMYSAQALRFFWLNVVVGFCFLLGMGVIAIPFIAGFVKVFQEMQPGGKLDFGLILSLVLPLIPILLLLAIAGIVVDVVLRDFMLPHYALEDASAGEAWSEVWTVIKAEQRQFIVYAVLRVILPTIASIGIFIVLLFPGLALAGAMAAIEYGIHSGFADATGGAYAAGIALQVFFGVVSFGLALLAGICVGGPVSTAIREYALLFYGGRYQRLGEILYPAVAPPANPGATAFA
jgi:hypothetical protein